MCCELSACWPQLTQLGAKFESTVRYLHVPGNCLIIRRAPTESNIVVASEPLPLADTPIKWSSVVSTI